METEESITIKELTIMMREISIIGLTIQYLNPNFTVTPEIINTHSKSVSLRLIALKQQYDNYTYKGDLAHRFRFFTYGARYLDVSISEYDYVDTWIKQHVNELRLLLDVSYWTLRRSSYILNNMEHDKINTEIITRVVCDILIILSLLLKISKSKDIFKSNDIYFPPAVWGVITQDGETQLNNEVNTYNYSPSFISAIYEKFNSDTLNCKFSDFVQGIESANLSNVFKGGGVKKAKTKYLLSQVGQVLGDAWYTNVSNNIGYSKKQLSGANYGDVKFGESISKLIKGYSKQ